MQTEEAWKQLAAWQDLTLIGRGPTAVVLRGLSKDTHQPQAIKLFPKTIPLEKLTDWADKMRQPPHAGLVPVLAVQETAVGHALIMPHYSGGSLRPRLGQLEPAQINQILLRLADVLHSLHEAGLVHQDIRPENVLFDEQGKCFLADATLRPLRHNRYTMEDDTAEYLSPEQIKGKAIDGRSDFYNLGILLYEMLTGQPAYSANAPNQRWVEQMTMIVPSVTETKADLPRVYDGLIQRLTAVNPDDRPATAVELTELIISAVAHIEGWPEDDDYTADLPIFDNLALYGRQPLTLAEREAQSAAIRQLKTEEEASSQRRMAGMMAQEVARQAQVQQQRNRQQTQERTLLILAASLLIIFVLAIVGSLLLG